ncbi:hypothetical protein [Frankia sp. Cppng1_Ct_nod]|uniref:hypothetical protein n=1 Tax=Frankia sp. Cppng1_Ct_nod TaxID=2897162 RepID=UPI001041B5A6|nr:hypothetical protein [Frankia sp. Cppng1_Ct_nod]
MTGALHVVLDQVRNLLIRLETRAIVRPLQASGSHAFGSGDAGVRSQRTDGAGGASGTTARYDLNDHTQITMTSQTIIKPRTPPDHQREIKPNDEPFPF